jgi:hypothetical protein
MEDSLIGLLFVLLPAILGLVGKKLDKAGKGGKQTLPRPEEVTSVEPEEITQEGQRSVRKKRKPMPVSEPSEQQPAAKKKAQTTYGVQEEEPRKKDKMDPKKLVIYSEIMKPKF